MKTLAHAFFVPYHSPPKTSAQQKGERIVTGKDGKQFVQHYLKGPQARDKKLLFWLLKRCAPPAALAGPLQVQLTIFYPWLGSEKKAVIASGMARWIETSPDVDNITKAYMDTMTELRFWNDDGQIASQTVEKRRFTRTGVRVRIWKLNPLTDFDLPPAPRGALTQPKLL